MPHDRNIEGDHSMKPSFRRMCAIAASVAAWTLVSPAQAQIVDIDINNPSCQDVVAICEIQSLAHELEINDVTTSAGTKCTNSVCSRDDFDPVLGVEFSVTWTVNPDGSVTVTDETGLLLGEPDPEFDPEILQQADAPGFEAFIAEGRRGSRVSCGLNQRTVVGALAPAIGTPTKITFCWASGPCLQPLDDVEEACMAYDPYDPPDPEPDPNRVKNFLQAHRIAPQQPINICGCRPDFVQFCDPSAPAEDPRACPAPEVGITALTAQGVATIGESTCQQITLGGRSIFIGDTCK